MKVAVLAAAILLLLIRGSSRSRVPVSESQRTGVYAVETPSTVFFSP